MLYEKILKPLFFKFDPEDVHDFIIWFGRLLGKFYLTRRLVWSLCGYRNKRLSQNVLGIEFPNPIGLAAGFDKDVKLMKILPCVGFGYEEIGSITGEPCKGNAKPRLWRIPKHKALVVYYGLKNPGSEVVARRLKGKKFNFPIGISVAKTNCKETAKIDSGVKDYVKAFNLMKDYADYITVNISCPNAFGGLPFTDPESLERLLTELDKIKTDKPVFLKLSPDLSKSELDDIIGVCNEHRIGGFVISNLTKKRDLTGIPEKDFENVGSGGVSGPYLQKISNSLINYVYKKTKGKYAIIGCGGIFTAEDIWEKMKAGASLVQLITGMIYHGPQLIGKLNQDLVKLMDKKE